ncbi:MAG: hypothetical protein ACR2G3_07330 [Solirubrobacterales bacterium]
MPADLREDVGKFPGRVFESSPAHGEPAGNGGAGAYAAATVNSGDVVNNSLKSGDLKDTAAVKSADVRDDGLPGGGLTGADIDESTLQSVLHDDFYRTSSAFTTTGLETSDGSSCDGNETCSVIVSCNPDDRAVSGGVGGLDLGTRVIADQPSSFAGAGSGWYIEWENDGTVDTLTPIALCINP